MGIRIKTINRNVSPARADYTKELDNYSIFNSIKKIFDYEINFSRELSSKLKEKFFSELSILLNSGIDLKATLEIYSEEENHKKIKNIIEITKKSIIEGDSLSYALSKTNFFNNYDINSIRIGEETGSLNFVINELCLYYQRTVQQKKQLLNAMNYPLIVLITAIIAVGFLLNYLVPSLANVFNKVNKDLPSLTKFIIHISEFFSNSWFIILLSVIIIYISYQIVKKRIFFRKISSYIVLRVPFLNDFILKVYMARFCQSMSLLLSSKTPMIKSLQLVEEMIDFYPMEVALQKIEEDIVRGKTLNESMSKFIIFDKKILLLVKLAEEVNQLDIIFNKMSLRYSDDVKTKINSINSILEPLLIIIIGVIVSIILIAMYLPIFQIGSTF